MEPMRLVVDRSVPKLIVNEAFAEANFILQSDGVCGLNLELARRVFIDATASIRLREAVEQRRDCDGRGQQVA